MSKIEELVKDSVDEINEANLEAVALEVRTLVKRIFQRQAALKELTEQILADKARLKALQEPEVLALEL